MYSITLTNGVSYNVQWCGVSSGVLIIQVIDNNDSIQTIFNVFADSELTQTIEFHAGNDSTRYDGYTTIIMIQDQRWQDGNVMIQLRKEDRQNG